MVDSPTNRNRLRKQELGTNTNSWGDTKLNEALDVIDQAMDGVLALALTGDLTLTTTNYSTADQAKRRVLKFTGTLSSAANVTVPSVEHEYAIINAAGASVTVKTFAGAGVEIPNGYQARVYCDASDVFNGSPTVLPGDVRVAGKVRNVTAGTESTDAVNKAQMESAIATAALPATAGTVRNSSSDTTAGYLSQKVVAAGAIKTRVLATATNELLQLKLAEAAEVTTTAQTASVGAITPINTSAGAIAVLNLPAVGSGDTALQDGDIVILVDSGGATETNAVAAITGNAGNIVFMGQAAAATLQWNGPNFSMLVFRWKAATSQWIGNGFD